MKVGGIKGAFEFLNRVEEKNPDAHSQGHGGHAQSDQQKDSAKQDEQNKEITREELNAAIEKFSKDGPTHNSGLQASIDEDGPGLKVVLMDVNGSVIRKLTGEEFVRLRDTAGKDAKIRGKILDQKL